MGDWKALSTTSLKAGWMCIPSVMGLEFCSGVYMRVMISWIRIEASGPMMWAPRIFSLPLSYMIGLLIGLSGLSGESQIVALRACGVPLRRLLRPIAALGGVVGILTAVISLVVLPQTNRAWNSLKGRIDIRAVASQIQPRVLVRAFGNADVDWAGSRSVIVSGCPPRWAGGRSRRG